MLSRLTSYWNNLSVSKKMYTLVGVMVFLITFELITLKYTVNILSSVRGFVMGEGLWSKAQKNALIEIQNYIIFRDEKHYAAFKEQLGVTLADREGRFELSKPEPNMDLVQKHLEGGRNHPSDIPGMANLLLNYSWISYMQKAIQAWIAASLCVIWSYCSSFAATIKALNLNFSFHKMSRNLFTPIFCACGRFC